VSEERAKEKFAKFVKKFNKRKLSEEYLLLPPKKKEYPPIPTTGDVSILLFYAYVPGGLMTRGMCSHSFRQKAPLI
jgi:hypothetical protein